MKPEYVALQVPVATEDGGSGFIRLSDDLAEWTLFLLEGSFFMPLYPKHHAEPDYKQAGYAQKRKIKNFFLLNLGTVIIALGIHFFKYPNNFALGGVSGISVVLAALHPSLTPAITALIINAGLLILALLVFGKSFAGKTLYASSLMSILLVVLEKFVPMTQLFSSPPWVRLSCLI